MTEDAPAPVWVLSDPRAGTAAQALGIAERVGAAFRTVRLSWGPLARLPMPLPTLAGLGAAAKAGIVPPWPQLVISAGRRSAPVALWLAGKGARLVHCMRPGFGAGRFDLLVIGRHDEPAEAPNVFPILGSVHRMTPTRLAAGREQWRELAVLPSPRVGLLVGGPVRSEGLDPAAAASLGAQVAGFAGSVLATTSRRTGAPATEALAAALAARPGRLFRWGDTGTNPFAGFLAWADLLVVTGDSVSMLSEALAAAAPVFVADLGGGARHRRLHASLYAAGQARPIAEAPAPFARTPLDEGGRVAAEIRARGLLLPRAG
jgi:mitochondrial fission protein ELM1